MRSSARRERLVRAGAAALLCGASLAFLARDILALGQPFVALTWAVGATIGLVAVAGRLRDQRGQASLEWAGLVLLAAIALGALATVALRIDGRPFAGFLAHRIACAVRGGCADGDEALARAYGDRDGALARALAPNLVYEPGERSLPVDWRRCRERACSDAPDDRDLDVHRSDSGERATAFVRRVRTGGRTYFLYWLYYPDSNSTLLASDQLWNHSPLRLAGRYPGFHPDDWEAYAVRVDGDGRTWVRSSSHGHWQGCKSRACRNRWTAHTGWTRVSRGSHAGHIPLRTVLVPGRTRLPVPGWPLTLPFRRRHVPQYPGRDLRERTTTAEALRLLPLEPMRRARREYRPLEPDGIRPPWRKRAWRDPEDDAS